MRAPVTLGLARMAAGFSWNDLSESARTFARQAVLDWFAVSIAGAREAPVRALARVLLSQGGSPGATAFFTGTRLPSMQASLFNGMASHALDYDDVHFAVPGHATAPVLSAVLAVAEETGASGARMIEAFVAGYETGCRVGLLLSPSHYSKGFHATATAGTFGATAGVGRLLGFDEATTARAFAIAATRASGLKAVFGTSGKPLQAGNAAQSGVLAALLAQAGVDAVDNVLEHRLGFAATHADSRNEDAAMGPPPLVRDLALPPPVAIAGSAAHHMEHNLFKYHATCYETHAAIEAAGRLRQMIEDPAGKIRSVTVEVNAHCDDICNIADPKSGSESKFSIRLATALGLLGAPTGDPSLFTDELVRDPEVARMKNRVTVELSHSVAVPVARVHATLMDGSTLTVEHDSSNPAADLAVQQAKLEKKFVSLVSPCVGEATCAELLARVRNVEGCRSLFEITESLI